MPGPHRGRDEPARLLRNAACVDCHEEAAAQWSASLHRAAFTDADFAAAYAHEPTRFCRGCHAPRPRLSAIRLGQPPSSASPVSPVMSRKAPPSLPTACSPR